MADDKEGFHKQASRLFLGVFLFVLLCVPRLFSLDAHWSSDEARWLRRSTDFIFAVRAGEFDQTLIAYHPGVMTMWVGGLRAFLLDTAEQVSIKQLVFARWFIGTAVLIGLLEAFFLLHRLFGLWSSVISFTFLASSPLFLAQSRRVHTDALAAVFCLLAVLLFLLYCDIAQKRRYLIGSGIAFGLACLSKSYSLVLLLWVPVCLLLFRARDGTWRQFFFDALVSVLCFLSCGLLTVIGLWPIFWTPAFGLLGLCLLGTTTVLFGTSQAEKHNLPAAGSSLRCLRLLSSMVVLLVISGYAIQTVWTVFDRVGAAVTTPHEVEHFFQGKVTNDPGWLFYPFVLSIKSAPFTLPLTLGGYLFLWKQRHRKQYARQFQVVLALACVVVLFTLCLSLTAKKFSRYLLPAFPILDVLAGVGLFCLVRQIGQRVRPAWGGLRRACQVACVVLVLGLTAIPVFALHPYYGTYYNLFWKVTDITKIITMGDASGLDLAATYLNQKPGAKNMTVQVSPLAGEFFSYYFIGRAYSNDRIKLKADYEVVYIRDSQVGRVPQTGKRNGTLEYVITLNGIDHVWIYRLKDSKSQSGD